MHVISHEWIQFRFQFSVLLFNNNKNVLEKWTFLNLKFSIKWHCHLNLEFDMSSNESAITDQINEKKKN